MISGAASGWAQIGAPFADFIGAEMQKMRGSVIEGREISHASIWELCRLRSSHLWSFELQRDPNATAVAQLGRRVGIWQSWAETPGWGARDVLSARIPGVWAL